MKWFTADPHRGHANIIKYCNRPYKNEHHMDKILNYNHNTMVGKDDDVYILGDFSMASKRYRDYLFGQVQQLNGRLHLILGNHDIKDPWFYIDIGFYSVHAPYLEVEEFICVHDPALSTINRKAKFLCGHIHDLFLINKNLNSRFFCHIKGIIKKVEIIRFRLITGYIFLNQKVRPA